MSFINLTLYFFLFSTLYSYSITLYYFLFFKFLCSFSSTLKNKQKDFKNNKINKKRLLIVTI